MAQSRAACRSVLMLAGIASLLLSTLIFGVSPAHAQRFVGPQSLGNSPVLRASEKGKCVYRCRIRREECVQDTSSSGRSEDPCWDKYQSCREGCGDVSPTSTTPDPTSTGPRTITPPPVTTTRADRVTRNPVIIRTGKWLEGLTFDGVNLWASESGQRTVAKFNMTSGRMIERVRVGRLPTSMASPGDGTVYALVATDKQLWKRRDRRGDSVLARLADCPEAMIEDIGWVWVLGSPSCSSEQSRVTRIDPVSGGQRVSENMGEWAQAIAAQEDSIWVAHARGPALTRLDRDTLAFQQFRIAGASLWAVTGGSRYVFGGGRLDENNGAGLVVQVDPRSGRELRRVTMDERIAKITTDDQYVIAVGDKGTIWVLSADTLRLERTITLDVGTFAPAQILFNEDALVIGAKTFEGENGAIFVVGDWRP